VLREFCNGWVMRVLVTGATGFIGGAIVAAAKGRGWEVGGVLGQRPAPSSPQGVSWRKLESWRDSDERFDLVIHAAALRHRHGVPPADYSRNNIALTEEVVECAQKLAPRILFLSSIAVYGWPKSLPIDETSPLSPNNEYGQSKIRCEELVRSCGLPFTIVQPSITYGPGDTDGMMDKILRMVAKRQFIVPGLGLTRVQLVYIEDLADIILAAATSPKTIGETFICTYRDPIRVGELLRLVSRTVGKWIPPVGPPRKLLSLGARLCELADRFGVFKGEPPLTRDKLATISVDRCYRIDRMRLLLGAEPNTGYQQGIQKMARSLGLARA
jgi:nucleoside-diphosphate-sugar epimerase